MNLVVPGSRVTASQFWVIRNNHTVTTLRYGGSKNCSLRPGLVERQSTISGLQLNHRRQYSTSMYPMFVHAIPIGTSFKNKLLFQKLQLITDADRYDVISTKHWPKSFDMRGRVEHVVLKEKEQSFGDLSTDSMLVDGADIGDIFVFEDGVVVTWGLTEPAVDRVCCILRGAVESPHLLSVCDSEREFLRYMVCK